MKEIWKDIPYYEGYYQISNKGTVRSCDRKIFLTTGNPLTPYTIKKGKVIKQNISNTGYYRICLHKNGVRKYYSVHRLVAEVFIPNPETKPQVNHIDGNRLNNCVENLEWATMSENVLHAYNTGLNYGLRGDLSPHKKSVLQYNPDGTLIKKWSCVVSAARELGGTGAGIYNACHKKNCKTYKGYIWKYAEGE